MTGRHYRSRTRVCVCVYVVINAPMRCRDGLPAPRGVWGLPAAHLRPLPHEGQRLVVARGVSAVHRVPAAPHHQLLLQREETLLQARLPTVSTSLDVNLLSMLAFVLLLQRHAGPPGVAVLLAHTEAAAAWWSGGPPCREWIIAL